MKATLAIIALAAVAQADFESNFEPPHPCYAYPSVSATLARCSTASAYCSSVLGGPGSFTRTFTKTKYLSKSKTTIPATTEVVSETRVTGTTTEKTTSTETIPTETVTTTLAPTCGGLSLPLARRAGGAFAAANCGFPKQYDPVSISGGCNCFLAVNTQVTVTKTKGGPKTKTISQGTSVTTTTIDVETTEITTIAETTTSTSTSVACKPTGCANQGPNSFAAAKRCPEEQLASGSCFCAGNLEGDTVCVANGLCADAQSCNDDGDCSENEWCIPNTGCGNGNVCLGFGSNCPNAIIGARIAAPVLVVKNDVAANPYKEL